MNTWRPSASLEHLKLRAELIMKVREFFLIRGVLEVETPIIYPTGVTDPQLHSFTTELIYPSSHQTFYLQTSPEYAMKRLLAAGIGDIYQICKAFRNGESGRKHNPEFTLLEWYRLGFDHFDLMDEVDLLLQALLLSEPAENISYQNLFEQYFSINPHRVSLEVLKTLARENGIVFDEEENSKDVWLDLLLTHKIEPHLGQTRPIFIYDYPVSQAALAKVKPVEDFFVGERFELYYKGMELANGYHELSDPVEQSRRFKQDNDIRAQLNLPLMPIDTFLLEALHDLPHCSGVALGLDRLIALAANTQNLADVLAFPLSPTQIVLD